MAHNVEDLRVRRTRKLLQQALIELTIEKGFADVTVRGIAERAMVNRSTFYRHYLDKYALLKEHIESLTELIDSESEGVPLAGDHDWPIDRPPAGLIGLLKHMQSNGDFYRVMLSPKGDPAFCAQSFRRYIDAGIRRILPPGTVPAHSGAPPVELSVSYVLHAGLGAILWWLDRGQLYPPEQVAAWLYQLSLASLGPSRGPGRVRP